MPDTPVVTLYRREQCGPCEVARALLDAYATTYRFAIHEVDVDSNPELAARYGERIPVAVHDGRELACAPFRRSTVEDALEALFGRVS